MAGGAIYDEGAHDLNIDSSSFADNHAGYTGGAIDTETNAPTSVTSSSFQSDSAGYGGAVYVHESGGPSTRAFTGDRFSYNSADSGGALDLEPPFPAAAALDRDEFDHNTATTGGGAVVDGSDSAPEALSSTGSSFIDNRAGSEGGALFINGGTGGWYYQPLLLTNATVSGNAASLGAGIYFSETEPSTLTNDTIAFNSGGGGVYGAGNVSTAGSGPTGALISTGVLNTIVAENSGGDCDAPFGGSADAGHNLDSDTSCFSAVGDKPGVDPLLAHPADNGGSVLTDALLPGSPAIDAGGTTGCASTDARDVPRPQGAACDIGSFEAADANLSLSSSAPPSAVVGNPFSDTLTLVDHGPGPSTGTTLVAQIPTGATLYGVTPSQGSCTEAASPATVSCQLGVIDDGGHATITMLISGRHAGTVATSSSASNDQGSTANAPAITNVTAPTVVTSAGSKPSGTTGAAKGAGTRRERIAGRVDPRGQVTVCFFQYGPRRTYGMVTMPKQVRGGPIQVKAFLSRLKPGVRYHYRLVAMNSSGASYGRDRTFRIRADAHKHRHKH